MTPVPREIEAALADATDAVVNRLSTAVPR